MAYYLWVQLGNKHHFSCCCNTHAHIHAHMHVYILQAHWTWTWNAAHAYLNTHTRTQPQPCMMRCKSRRRKCLEITSRHWLNACKEIEKCISLISARWLLSKLRCCPYVHLNEVPIAYTNTKYEKNTWVCSFVSSRGQWQSVNWNWNEMRHTNGKSYGAAQDLQQQSQQFETNKESACHSTCGKRSLQPIALGAWNMRWAQAVFSVVFVIFFSYFKWICWENLKIYIRYCEKDIMQKYWLPRWVAKLH